MTNLTSSQLSAGRFAALRATIGRAPRRDCARRTASGHGHGCGAKSATCQPGSAARGLRVSVDLPAPATPTISISCGFGTTRAGVLTASVDQTSCLRARARRRPAGWLASITWAPAARQSDVPDLGAARAGRVSGRSLGLPPGRRSRDSPGGRQAAPAAAIERVIALLEPDQRPHETAVGTIRRSGLAISGTSIDVRRGCGYRSQRTRPPFDREAARVAVDALAGRGRCRRARSAAGRLDIATSEAANRGHGHRRVEDRSRRARPPSAPPRRAYVVADQLRLAQVDDADVELGPEPARERGEQRSSSRIRRRP